jgi:DNA repair exonuclease SbcCD ATPase subunit
MLESLEIENFGRHERLEVTFRKGLNGIIGRNGSGKSTILSAAAFALTGEALSDSNLQAEVRNGTTSAKVKLVMQTATGPLEIKRSIGTTTKSRVGVKHSSGSSDKAAESLDIVLKALDTNVSVIYNNVFARQGQIDKILDLTATTRLKELQQVFNLAQSEQAYKLLGVEVSQYVVTPGLEASLKTATAELSKLRDDLKVAIATEEQLRKEVNDIRTWSQDIITRQTEFLRHQVSCEVAKQRRDEAQFALYAAKSALDEANANKEAASTQYVDCTQEALATANAELERLRNAMASYGKYQMLLQQLEAAEADVKAVNIPFVDELQLKQGIQELRTKINNAQSILDGNIAADKDPLKKFKDKVAGFKAELLNKLPVPEEVGTASVEVQALKKLLADLETITTVCPTCKRTMDGVDPSHVANEKASIQLKLMAAQQLHAKLVYDHKTAEHVREQTVRLELVQAEEVLRTESERMYSFFNGKLTTFKAELEPLEVMLADHERNKTILEQKQLTLTKAKAAAQAAECVPVLSKDIELVGAKTERIRTGITALREAQIAVTNAVAAYDKADKELEQFNKAFTDVLDAKTDKQPSPEEVEQAKQSMEKLKPMQTELETKQSEAGQLKAQVNYLETSVGRLSEQLAKEAKDAAWVSVVQQARDALHVSGYPADVMREYTSVINKRIAYYLDILEAEFSFYLDPESMSFVAKFPDGRLHDGCRLSGAQRVISGMCFRLALADTFARSVGFLCLDEPSAYMDPDSIQSMQNLFLRLKSFASSQNRQIILITHERAFMSSMDHVIEVG